MAEHSCQRLEPNGTERRYRYGECHFHSTTARSRIDFKPEHLAEYRIDGQFLAEKFREMEVTGDEGDTMQKQREFEDFA